MSANLNRESCIYVYKLKYEASKTYIHAYTKIHHIHKRLKANALCKRGGFFTKQSRYLWC